MSDIVDRANLESEALLSEQIRQVTKGLIPNNLTDCIDCGEPIGEQRKQSVPWATRCTKCQTLYEGKK